jgi:hypothetical protein
MDQVHDPRFLPRVVYHKRFLLWWGLCLFLGKLGSRRALDSRLDTDGPQLLDNLNRLADPAAVRRLRQAANGGGGRTAARSTRPWNTSCAAAVPTRWPSCDACASLA